MKLLRCKRRQRGAALLLAILVIIALLVWIGVMCVLIYRAIQRVRRPEPAEMAQIIQNAVTETRHEYQALYSSNVISVALVAPPVVVPWIQFTPFDVAVVVEDVERSTDMVTWETVAQLQPGETYTDTNAPTDRAFYRKRQ